MLAPRDGPPWRPVPRQAMCRAAPSATNACEQHGTFHVNITACPLWRRATFRAAWPVAGPRRGKRVTRARQRRHRHSQVTVTGVLPTRRSAWPRVPPSQTGGLAWRVPLAERPLAAASWPRAPVIGAPAVVLLSRWRFATVSRWNTAAGGVPGTCIGWGPADPPPRHAAVRSYFPPWAPSGPATQTLPVPHKDPQTQKLKGREHRG